MGRAPGAVNDPARQAEHNVGPLPVGVWRMGDPVNTQKHGPFFIPLTPEPGTETFGRSAFGMHGDKKDPTAPPRSASEGCVILPLDVRERGDGEWRDRGALRACVAPKNGSLFLRTAFLEGPHERATRGDAERAH